MTIKNQLICWKKNIFFCKLKKDKPSDEEIERDKQNIKIINNKNGKKLTELCLTSDVISLICLFETPMKVSIKELKNLTSIFYIMSVYLVILSSVV